MAQARRRRQCATAGRRPCFAPIVEAYGALIGHLCVSATVCGALATICIHGCVMLFSVVVGVYVSVGAYTVRYWVRSRLVLSCLVGSVYRVCVAHGYFRGLISASSSQLYAAAA